MRTLFVLLMLILATAPARAEHKFMAEPRRVFWKGDVTFKVASFDKAREEVLQLAEKYEGHSYSENTRVASNGRRTGDIMVRVPENCRYQFLKEAHALGILYSQKISAPDLTEEFVDVGRRLRNLHAEEDQLLVILKQARHVLEILQVQSHLYNVRTEIERLTSRQGEIAMKSQSALFTIHLFEAPAVAEPVTPGGAAQFFPRWWSYSALPAIKRQGKTTWYAVSSTVLGWILGPTLLWGLGGGLLLSIFVRKVWPDAQDNLRVAAATLQKYGISPWWLPLLYCSYRFLSSATTLLIVCLMLAAVTGSRLRCRTAEIQPG